MRISAARQIAFQVLSDVAEGDAFTNLALRQALSRVRLDDRDRALCSEIVYGTVQRQRSIDALIKKYCTRPLKGLDKKVLTLIRMAIYQLAFLDKVPAYAAINESVEIAKRVAPKASGFVNGVLRGFGRDERDLSARLLEAASKTGSWADEMGILYSYPTWLVRAWEHSYGRDKTRAIMEAGNVSAPMSVRVNVMKTSRADILATTSDSIRGAVMSASLISDVGMRMTRGMDVEQWDLYQQGVVTVQDEGAMLIAPLLLPETHHRILDMCAAPGTKTTHIAELQRDTGHVDACDIHGHKMELIQSAAERLGMTSIHMIHEDARLLPNQEGYAERYDAVLLDAPCSGFGVLRHRPDIRWKRTENDVKELMKLQRDLIAAASKLVRPGGLIVYSTCTLLPQENEEMIQAVVAEGEHELVWDDIRQDLPAEVARYVPGPEAGLLLTPDLYGTDGFYMARLKKRTRG